MKSAFSIPPTRNAGSLHVLTKFSERFSLTGRQPRRSATSFSPAMRIVCLMAILSAASQAFAAPFAGTYTFVGTTGTNDPYAYNGTDIASLTEGELGRTNLPSSNSPGNYRSSDFALDNVSGSLTGSYDPTKYFEFSLTAASGSLLSMSNITFGLGRSGLGPRSWAWASSVDDFASFTGDYSSLGASGLFSTATSATNPPGAIYFLTDSTATTGTNIVLNLSGTSFQNLSSVSFRLYGWNSEASAGAGGLQGPLSFSGSLAVVPEPSTWVMGAAGIACAGWGAWRRRKRA